MNVSIIKGYILQVRISEEAEASLRLQKDSHPFLTLTKRRNTVLNRSTVRTFSYFDVSSLTFSFVSSKINYT